MSSESQPTRKSPNLLLIGALIISLSITLGSIFFIIYRLANPPTADTGAAVVDAAAYFDGSTAVDPPRQISDFTLTGNDGQPLSFSELHGKVTLLYFGYTHCPDICPMTLSDFQQVKTALGEQAEQVNFVMISVDGARDTPEQMQRYLSGFDPEFVGMTGSADELQGISDDFGLYFHANTDQGEHYTVDHTGSIFMIDEAGLLRTIFTFGTEPDVISEHVQDLL